MSWVEKPTILSYISKEQNYIFIDESGDIKDLKTIIKKVRNGECINVRDSNFVLNSIFLSKKNLLALYKSFSSLKKKYNIAKVNFHSVDIDHRRNAFSQKNMNDETRMKFLNELNDIIINSNYYLIATAINKYDYVRKYCINEAIEARDIIICIYEREFLKIEKMLSDLDKNAVLVIEESSNPKIDNLILQSFNELRIRKKIKRITALYFTSKNAKVYPVGTELADLTSKPIYQIFRNLEFIQILRKIYRFHANKFSSLEIFDKPIKTKKPAIINVKQDGGLSSLEN